MIKHVFMATLVLTIASVASTAAQAQQSCLGPDRLAVQHAQTRPGSNGTWNYVARIANSSARAIRFDVRFIMANAQPNRDIYPTQTLNSRTFREYILATGTAVVDATRIIGNTRLTCR